jgi:hypothetical protein
MDGHQLGIAIFIPIETYRDYLWNLISTDLPQALKIVIPEEILIGNPVFN